MRVDHFQPFARLEFDQTSIGLLPHAVQGAIITKRGVSMSKEKVSSLAVVFFAVVSLVGFSASPALAIKEFKDAFQAKYIKPDSTDANDVALAQAFGRASCAVCHAGGGDKRIRNDYGKQLAKLIHRGDKSNKAKIAAAFETVAKMKSQPADAASPTFGER